MHFLNLTTGFILAALLAVALSTAAVWYGARRRRRLLAQLVAPPLDRALTASVDPLKRRLRVALFFAALVCLLAAVARPWWGSHLVPAPKRSRDLLFVVDTSRSMLARDVAPSRLEHTRWWIRELVNQCPGDRFGLVAFAGDAFLECPLTQDTNTFFQFLNALDTATIPVGGTNLAQALEVARKAFRAAEGRHQAVALISDGEELEGDARSTLAFFKEHQIPLFVVGVGNPDRGAMIQLADNSLLRDKDGTLVTTRLNEAGLKALSDTTGGIYVRSTSLAANVAPVLTRVKALVPAEGVQGTQRRPLERFQGPLLLALLLVLFRLALGERRRPVRSAAALPIFVALTLASGVSPDAAAATGPPNQLSALAPAAPANLLGPDPLAAAGVPGAARSDEDTAKRRELLRQLHQTEAELTSARPEQLPRLHFNLGVLHQELGNADDALREYDKAIGTSGSQNLVRALAYQNQGVVRHQQARQKLAKDPDGALHDLKAVQNLYKEAMRLLPANQDAAKDQELLQRDIKLAEAIRKLSEQIKKQLEEAREKTKAALESQTAANEKPPASAERQKQQSEADQKTGAAKQAAEALNRAAQPVTDPQTKERFAAAEKEIAEAQTAQQQTEQVPRTDAARQESAQKAAQHLEKAHELFGGAKPPPSENSSQPKDPQSKPGQDKQPQQNQGDSGQPQPKPEEKKPDQQDPAGQQQSVPKPGDQQPAGQAGEKKDAGEIDPRQAAALLREIQQEEQDYREAVKLQRKNQNLQEPERDW